MLGEKIKNLRIEKGLSQEELAQRLSVVRQTVSKWEKGLSFPDSELLIKLAEVMNVSVSELIGEENEPTVEKSKKRHSLKAFEIVLLVLGSPVWLSLLIAAFAVILSLYVALWAVIISLWAVFASLSACAVGGIAACVIFCINGNVYAGVFALAAGIVCAGLAIFMFYGCKTATKGTLLLTKKIAIWVKNCFAGKEEAK